MTVKNGCTDGQAALLTPFTSMSDMFAFVIPVSATLSNTSIEDRNMSRLTYSGTWNNNSDPLFSGGTTTYTNQDGASVSLNFTGEQHTYRASW